MIFLPVQRLVLAAVVGLLLLAPVTSVSAHAQLVRSDPAYGSVLATSPASVRLWFSEQIDPAFSKATLVASNGTTIATPQPASRAADDQAELILPLGPLAPGTYTVVWITVSAADGHKANGAVVFTIRPASAGTASQVPSGVQVGATPAGTSTPITGTASVGLTSTPVSPTVSGLPQASGSAGMPMAAMDNEGPTLFDLVIRWLQLLGVVLIVGGVFMGLVVVRPLVARAELVVAPLISIWRRAIRVALLLLGVGVAGTLLVQVATVSSLGQLFQPSVLVPLLASRWGILWAIRVWCCLLLVPLLLPAFWQLRRLPLVIALLVAVPLLMSFSLMSHAAAIPSGVPLAVATDWLHFAMASLWAGGLAFLLLLLLYTRHVKVEQRTPLTLQLVGRFSQMALIAVGVLIATGVYSSLQQISGLQDLTSTSYGQTLLIKLALAGAALLLGGYHWLVARPQIDSVAGQRGPVRRLLDRLQGTMGVESGIAALVLLAASGLVQMPPPRSMHMQMDAGLMASSPAGSATALAVAPASTQPPALVVSTALPSPTIVPTALPSATPTPAPYHTSVLTAGLEIGLTIDAQAVGEQQFTVTVKKQTAPVAADRVRLQVSALDRDLGTTLVELQPQAAGMYTARSPVISLKGRWQIVALVRRRGLEDVTAAFSINIP